MPHNKAAAWLLRAVAVVLTTMGVLFVGTTTYILFMIAPELIVMTVIGAAMLTASAYLRKLAKKIVR